MVKSVVEVSEEDEVLLEVEVIAVVVLGIGVSKMVISVVEVAVEVERVVVVVLGIGVS